MSAGDADWTAVLEPQSRRLELGLAQLWQYKDLVGLLVRRDFVATYKQTILGPAWFLIQPLVTTLTFVVVFGRMVALSTDGQPPVLFYMLGTIFWSYFSSCLVQTAGTFVNNAGLFGKVYFPRLVVPVATVLSNLITLMIQMIQFVAIAAFLIARGYVPAPTLWIAMTPLLLAMMAALGLGLGLAISSLTTRYRDLQHVVAFGTPLLMYAAPIIYPLSSVPARYRLLISANPMTPLVEALRYAFLGAGDASIGHLLYAAVVTLTTLVVGVALFNRTERNFMDTV